MNDKLMSIFKLEQSLLQKVPFDYQLPNLLLGLQGKLLLQLLLVGLENSHLPTEFFDSGLKKIELRFLLVLEIFLVNFLRENKLVGKALNQTLLLLNRNQLTAVNLLKAPYTFFILLIELFLTICGLIL